MTISEAKEKIANDPTFSGCRSVAEVQKMVADVRYLVAEVQKRHKVGNQETPKKVAEVADRLPISATIKTLSFQGLTPAVAEVADFIKINRNREIRARNTRIRMSNISNPRCPTRARKPRQPTLNKGRKS